jgi:hypothetical protein
MCIDLACLVGLALLSLPGRAPVRSESAAVNTSYRMAQPILEALGDDLPAELKNRSPAELEAAWPRWVRQHEREVGARLTRGKRIPWSIF